MARDLFEAVVSVGVRGPRARGFVDPDGKARSFHDGRVTEASLIVIGNPNNLSRKAKATIRVALLRGIPLLDWGEFQNAGNVTREQLDSMLRRNRTRFTRAASHSSSSLDLPEFFTHYPFEF